MEVITEEQTGKYLNEGFERRERETDDEREMNKE